MTLTQGMQPDSRVPNPTTLQALAEAATPGALQRYASADALFDELEAESCLRPREITIDRRDPPEGE